jgi:protein gp37
MADKTKIEWTDSTWNPITGCTPCSPGCDHCYARRMAERFPQVHGGEFAHVKFHPDRLQQPLHWRQPRRIFVCSMGDLFHEDVPDKWRNGVFQTFDAAPRHTYMVLTKRPQAMADYINRTFHHDAMASVYTRVWLGVTVCNQAEADAKIPVLLRTPAALRFVSIEPMLGPVALNRALPDAQSRGNGDAYIDWVICGGETGPGARPMCLNWANDIRSQCADAGVPFFFKGHGTYLTPKRHPLYHVLDGRKWHEFPKAKEG